MNDQDTLYDFESRIGAALLEGASSIEASEKIIRFFLKKPEDWEAFKQNGNFIYKNVYVTLKV